MANAKLRSAKPVASARKLRCSVLSFAIAAASGATCNYHSDAVTWTNVSDIVSSNSTGTNFSGASSSKVVNIGTDPLPERAQGAFWLVDDGGDAIVALGPPPGGRAAGAQHARAPAAAGVAGGGEPACSVGELGKDSKGRWCTSVSTVQPGGWLFQGEATPRGVFGGKFPSPADRFYRGCGTRWEFCFDDEVEPSAIALRAIPTRSCANVFALTTTAAEYKGRKDGGHYWRVTTKALGVVPMPPWLPGNFDMIQILDAEGRKLQPAWNNFAIANEQIVSYQGGE